MKIPYGRHQIDEHDIASVVETLRSDWLTTGPKVEEFESAVCLLVGAKHGVAVSSGTAALHAMMHATRVGPGDEVIVPALTFAATANCVLYQGATPVFADVLATNLTLDPESVQRLCSSRTRAVIAVDYAGHPCNYSALREICEKKRIPLLADACHSIGATYKGSAVGLLAEMTAFSFHPVKQITTGEGGMIVTQSDSLARHLRQFRNHGLTTDARNRELQGGWEYDMVDLGFNYRLSDLQCSLGIAQLSQLTAWTQRRRHIAARYRSELKAPLVCLDESEAGHSYHLFVVRFKGAAASGRDEFIRRLRSRGILANVHYKPVYYHSYYQKLLGDKKGCCPQAESAFEEIVSLPMFPKMTDRELDYVIKNVNEAVMPAQAIESAVDGQRL